MMTMNTKAIVAAAEAMAYIDSGLQYVKANEDCDIDLNIKTSAIIAAGVAAMVKFGIQPEDTTKYMAAAVRNRAACISASSSEAMKTVYNCFPQQ